MTSSLLTWLEELSAEDWDRRPAGEWEGSPPADPGALARTEEQLGVRFPDDYRALVVRGSDGGSLTGPQENLNLERVEDVVERTSEQRYVEALPGMIVIGDNGGGAVYFYDPEGRLDHAAWAVYWVELGDLSLPRARSAGRNLTEVCHRIADGVMFFDEPPIGGADR